MNRIEDRLKGLIKEENITENKLAELSGVAYNTIMRIVKSEYKRINHDTIYTLASFFNVSFNWLLNGKGDKKKENLVEEPFTSLYLKSEQIIQEQLEIAYNKLNIYHIGQEANAGFTGMPVEAILEKEELDKWYLPGLPPGKYYSFVVNGKSMEGTIKENEIIITSSKPVEKYDDIENGYIYVVVMKTGISVKRVEKHLDREMLWLFSDNEDFKDEEVPVEEIINLYKGRRVVSYNLSRRMREE